MKTELADIQTRLKGMMTTHFPPLRIRKDDESMFEVCGTKEAMQGKQKVDGYFFAGIVAKPKDIRLYFFPIYTHAAEFEGISADLRKFLKGKSCFHIKRLTAEVEAEIEGMVKKGVELYVKDGVI